MHYSITYFLLFLLWSFSAHAAHQGIQPGDSTLTEGPYVFVTDSGFIVEWIEAGRHYQQLDSQPQASIFEQQFGFNPYAHFAYTLSPEYTQQYDFQGIDKFVAISDIHGQYDLFVHLLKTHGLVDDGLNWIYGDGHLVVLGDIMDRGEGVTEALWLTYKLEQQALLAGGHVHFLCGNHELMVMDGDLRYIHEKYAQASSVFGESYAGLYSSKTLMGQWLGRRPVMLTINDVLFVHAGISPEFIEQGYTAPQVNRLFRERIYPQPKEEYRQNDSLNFLARTNGPLWYRGYFRNEQVSQAQLDSILAYFNKNRLVVGHTSFPELQVLYNGKLFAIDSSIKTGKSGEVLIYKGGRFFRGSMDGAVSPLPNP